MAVGVRSRDPLSKQLVTLILFFRAICLCPIWRPFKTDGLAAKIRLKISGTAVFEFVIIKLALIDSRRAVLQFIFCVRDDWTNRAAAKSRKRFSGAFDSCHSI